jgi:hypothetical protein
MSRPDFEGGRSLAEKMGGRLTYRRQSDQTVFELILPSAHVLQDHDARVPAASAAIG